MALISSLILALASMAADVAAQGNEGGGLGSFTIPSITSHQPNGVKDGDVDYYNMGFTVNTTFAGSESGYCHATWSDNEYTSQDATSDYVPTGSWIQCDSSEANFGDGNSEFQFQLFSPFAIGNYSFQVKQTYDDGGQIVITSYQYYVSNTSTSYDYSCTIYPYEDDGVQQHASGDCSLAANETLSVPVESDVDGPIPSSTTASSTVAATSTTTVASSTTASAPSCEQTVAIDFPVIETTKYGQTVLVAGNITQLGNWNTGEAFALNANQYTASNHLWTGTVYMPSGTAFEYKYILRHIHGGISWETGANREYTVPSNTCGEIAAGNDPDTFRQ